MKKEWIKKILLNKLSATSFFIFVIWKKEKLWIVINLWWINTVLYSDTYSLLKQNTILRALSRVIIFSFINIICDFFQQSIAKEDQWKTAFIIFHWEQKMLTVSIIKLINFLKFFQHCMKELFAEYFWKFILIYVNDIIVFSHNLKNYLHHLNWILNILKQSDITLAMIKCYFAFFLYKF